MPAAAVVLVNERTDARRYTVTNERGEYSFPSLDPGNYAVSLSLPGFKPFTREGLEVATQAFLTLDIVLEAAGVEESVTVRAERPTIETANASFADALDSRALRLLPTATRNPFALALTVPTVQSSADARANRLYDQSGTSRVAIGGGGVRANEYLLDGLPLTELSNRTATIPGIETLEDVRLQVHTYDAEVGRTGGGVFNATARSGINTFRGSSYYQLRPGALVSDNFFDTIRGQATNDRAWRNGGGGGGGPIIRGKTFFWLAAEANRDGQAQTRNLLVPTQAMRNGDFSRVTDAQGRPITIYDPLTTDASGNRQPFPGNIIPADRINPVGRALVAALPLPSLHPDRDDGNVNLAAQAVFESRAVQGSTKLDHHFSNAVALSGVYLHQQSTEPDANYFSDAPYAAPTFHVARRVNLFVLNNTYVLNPVTVATIRAGLTAFDEDITLPFPFDMRTVPGLDQSFANALPLQKFPALALAPYSNTGYQGQSNTDYYSRSVNGVITRLAGAHSIKVGADYRVVGAQAIDYGQSAGSFSFDGQFTGSNATSPSPTSRNAIADLLLGYPSSGSLTLNSPFDQSVHYFGVFVQDDWRINGKLTVNLGLRVERETGLADRNDRLVVGFDRTILNPIDVVIPADPVARTPARQVTGGLVFAGQDGANDYLGRPPAAKLSPRIGLAYAAGDSTVVRAGYGLFWAPWQSGVQASSGYSQTSVLQQDRLLPITSINNPFPNGLAGISGNTLGALTGISSNITFTDPDRTAPRVHQYSVDVQRALPGSLSAGVAYIGATGRRLTWGGTGVPAININQVDPKYLSLGAGPVNRLTELVANPFFGNPAAGAFASRPTIQRNQLLRPYPQFGDVGMIHSTQARSQYHAGVFTLTKRATRGWSGRLSYTYSRFEDNQFGQSTSYSNGPGILNHYTAIPWSEYYDPDAEYGRSRLDSPHKLVATPIVELPFGRGRRWLRGGLGDVLAGGWSVALVMQLQSGFPVGVGQQVNNTNLLGATQRPNLVTGVDPQMDGDLADRLREDPNDNLYLNPAAFTQAPAGTLGNAPRLLDVYSPLRNATDLALTKELPLGGTRRATLRMEVINLFDTSWFSSSNPFWGNANFGRVTGQANYPRTIQFSGRVSF